MPKLSVTEAAERLGVSPIRVRQRIEEGSLIAEKVGNRWLVDLSVIPESRPRGRPVKREQVWDAIRRLDAVEELKQDGPSDGKHLEALLKHVFSDKWQPGPKSPLQPDLQLPDGSMWQLKTTPSSRRRALTQFRKPLEAPSNDDLYAALSAILKWLGGRADRRLYRVATPDAADLRVDGRIALSGLSHPRSGMSDPRIIEGYVAVGEVDELVSDYWLDPPGVDVAPNVFLHVAPGKPTEVSALMLAADLWEHERSRERNRAVELMSEVLK